MCFYILDIVRHAAMVGSCIGIAWSLMSFHKATRVLLNEKERGLSFCGGIFYFTWRVCEVAPRIIVIALLAAQCGYIMFIIVGIHWVAMSVSVWLQGTCTSRNGSKRPKKIIVLSILLGYSSLFCYLNVFDGKTRYKAIYHYSITFTENIIVLTLWGYFTEHKHDFVYFAMIGITSVLMCIQLIIQILYFNIFHPSTIKYFYKAPKHAEKEPELDWEVKSHS